MQPELRLRNGTIITLSDETYELILGIVQAQEGQTEAAQSIEELEAEFAALFTTACPSTDELLEERRRESGY